MTTKDEALKLAREALESAAVLPCVPAGPTFEMIGKAIIACRAALAQKGELEPVAWMLECPTMSGDTGWILSWSQSGAGLCDRLRGEEHEKPLYTAPPKRRLLTEKEICDAWLYATGYDIENGDSTESRTVHISPDEILEFARIVEGSLGVDHDAQP